MWRGHATSCGGRGGRGGGSGAGGAGSSSSGGGAGDFSSVFHLSEAAGGRNLQSCGAATPPFAAASRNWFLNLSICWCIDVHTRFWEDILLIRKLVEFRSPQQRIAFVPEMRLLFSLNAVQRRKDELLGALCTDPGSGQCPLPMRSPRMQAAIPLF
jgi:hypothetical protein